MGHAGDQDDPEEDGVFGSTTSISSQPPVETSGEQEDKVAELLIAGTEEKEVQDRPVPTASNDVLHVQARAYASQSQRDWWEKAFPTIFLFGRGGPSEERRVAIGQERLFQHYLELSTGLFQHPWFCLHGYDVLSRKSMSKGVFIQCKKRVDSYGALTAQEVSQAIRYADACKKAAKQGRHLPDAAATVGEASAAFVNSVKLIHSHARHSEAYIEKNRLRLNSMMYRFGTPQNWYVFFFL